MDNGRRGGRGRGRVQGRGSGVAVIVEDIVVVAIATDDIMILKINAAVIPMSTLTADIIIGTATRSSSSPTSSSQGASDSNPHRPRSSQEGIEEPLGKP